MKGKGIIIFVVVLFIGIAYLYISSAESSPEISQQYRDLGKVKVTYVQNDGMYLLNDYVNKTGVWDNSLASLYNLNPEDSRYGYTERYPHPGDDGSSPSPTPGPDPGPDPPGPSPTPGPDPTPPGPTPTPNPGEYSDMVKYLMACWGAENNSDTYHTQGTWTCTWEGRTISGYYRQCNAGVSSWLHLTGRVTLPSNQITTIAQLKTYGTEIASYSSSADAIKNNQLQVGDIIFWGGGHVAVVIEDTGTEYHILDTGNNPPIARCLAYGYSIVVPKNDQPFWNSGRATDQGAGGWYPSGMNPSRPISIRRL